MVDDFMESKLSQSVNLRLPDRKGTALSTAE